HQIQQVYDEITQPNELMLLLNPIFAYKEVGSELSIQDLQTLEAWGKRKMVYLNKAFLTLRKNGGNHISAPVCKAASTTVVISPENKLMMPCYHLEVEALPINDDLYGLRKSVMVQDLIAMEGKYKECEGCTVNCYFQPSFAVNLNQYFFDALPSTLKYAWEKGTWKEMVKF
ncbi:MAG: radical SAM protein, partial [Bacteroidetes bacterium]|nr:radical SAM protein [Bacteroidota bacterium]